MPVIGLAGIRIAGGLRALDLVGQRRRPFAIMANGLLYAIAAQVAYPERQVVAFVGDGGFSMLMALLRGEPNREKIALTVLADKVRALV